MAVRRLALPHRPMRPTVRCAALAESRARCGRPSAATLIKLITLAESGAALGRVGGFGAGFDPVFDALFDQSGPSISRVTGKPSWPFWPKA